MDEIRRRFSQIEQKGISVKASLSEMVGTATFVLLGCLVTTYMGFFHGKAGMQSDLQKLQMMTMCEHLGEKSCTRGQAELSVGSSSFS